MKGASSAYGEGKLKAADYHSGSVMADWRWGSYRRMWQLQGDVELPGGGERAAIAGGRCLLNATPALSIRASIVMLWLKHWGGYDRKGFHPARL